MIVRERENEFVMISQHDHAQISGEFAKHWKSNFFKDLPKRDSVELAIREHDRGWISVDSQPLWKDENHTPFSFMDYPLKDKLELYKTGIDEVEAIDNYAALLCSEHYIRFTSRSPSQAAQGFVASERTRQEQLIKRIVNFDKEHFQFHYDLLAFCDTLSLYVCLNEPGTTREDIHRFYQNGIPVPATFSFFDGDLLRIDWKDEQTILIETLPFVRPIEIKVKQKNVSKKMIATQGIKTTYAESPLEAVTIWMKG